MNGALAVADVAAGLRRWIWLVIAAHTQLRLARPLALRQPLGESASPNKRHRPASAEGSGTCGRRRTDELTSSGRSGLHCLNPFDRHPGRLSGLCLMGLGVSHEGE